MANFRLTGFGTRRYNSPIPFVSIRRRSYVHPACHGGRLARNAGNLPSLCGAHRRQLRISGPHTGRILPSFHPTHCPISLAGLGGAGPCSGLCLRRRAMGAGRLPLVCGKLCLSGPGGQGTGRGEGPVPGSGGHPPPSRVTTDNEASIGFHEAIGFVRRAFFPNCGYKLGTWHGVVWLEKQLAPPDAPTSFPEPWCREEHSI